MSDVAFARAGWFGKTLFLLLAGIAWLWDLRPVIIPRAHYRRLLDQQYIVDDATRVLSEYQRLKTTYEVDDYHSL